MALIRKVDCVRLYVSDLEAGLSFYRDRLGHELIWRTATAAGLRLPESEAELVIQTEDQRQEVDLLVHSADESAKFIEQAGGKVIVPPFVRHPETIFGFPPGWTRGVATVEVGEEKRKKATPAMMKVIRLAPSL